jgi:hypothetical protein
LLCFFKGFGTAHIEPLVGRVDKTAHGVGCRELYIHIYYGIWIIGHWQQRQQRRTDKGDTAESQRTGVLMYLSAPSAPQEAPVRPEIQQTLGVAPTAAEGGQVALRCVLPALAAAAAAPD